MVLGRTLIAALLQGLAVVAVVSTCARSKSPLAAMVAAEESAGRGAGVRGALKSLRNQDFKDRSEPEGHKILPRYNAVIRNVIQKVGRQLTSGSEIFHVTRVFVHCKATTFTKARE